MRPYTLTKTEVQYAYSLLDQHDEPYTIHRFLLAQVYHGGHAIGTKPLM